MKEPEVVIVIEGGVVSAVATTKESLKYRIIDRDVRDEGSGGSVEGMEADATGVDVEEYTRGITREW